MKDPPDPFQLMTLHEPFTVLTDVLLSALTLLFSFRLSALFRRDRRFFVLCWALTFFMVAAGAALGAASHGFKPYFSEGVRTLVWKSTVFSIGLASLFMLMGAGLPLFRGWSARLFGAAALAKFLVFAGVMSASDRFLFVLADYLVSMAAVLVFSLREIRVPASGAAWTAGGILASFAAAAVQQSPLSFGPLNHNDLYHVLQMGACSLLYRGVKVRSTYKPRGTV